LSSPRSRRPLPQPTPETAPFWDACREHRLEIQRCTACGRFYFPPRPFCPRPECFSGAVEWVAVSGRATLDTYVINHRPAPGFEEKAPYAIAVVQLEEGPKLMTNIAGIENTPENLVLDMPLEVDFEDVDGDITLYTFRPAGGTR
jgi:uncharacterized OB-fold protein